MSLIKSAEKISKADEKALARRVMWSSLDERIEKVFKQHEVQTQYTEILGNLYLRRAKDNELIKSSGLRLL